MLERVRVAREYVAATYGFRNHWYPVRLSRDLEEDRPLPVTVLGENLLLNRLDRVVYAIKDRCLHRGVNFSHKLECYKRGTVTCWYHGFTYRHADGLLCDIAGSESSAVIGKKRRPTYPVREAQGLAFVLADDFAHATRAFLDRA